MFDGIAQAITGFVQHNNNPVGLTLLALSALLEYVFPPFPGDTVTLFGVFLVTRYEWSLALVFVALLVGSAIGAMADFYVGVWMGSRYRSGRFLRREAVREQVEKVIASFRRHGEVYIALNRFLPAVRAVFFVAAGMAGLRPGRVLFFALVSAAGWNLLLVGVGYAVGANWGRITAVFRAYSVVAWSVVGAAALLLAIRWVVRRSR
jgi:membrane protein DedA with SNARE-associated domain